MVRALEAIAFVGAIRVLGDLLAALSDPPQHE